MEWSKESSIILNQIESIMPAFIKNKKLFIQHIVIAAHFICFEQNRSVISEDDLFYSILRFSPKHLKNLFIKKLHIKKTDLGSYCDVSIDHRYINTEELFNDLTLFARDFGAVLNKEHMNKIIDAFQFSFENYPVYFKSTTKPGSTDELYIRTGHIEWVKDLITIIKSNNLLSNDSSNLAVFKILQSRFPDAGRAIDVSLKNGLQKLWIHCPQKPGSVKKLSKIKGVPSAVRSFTNLFKKYGLTHFSFTGVDLINNSMNIYFYLNQPQRYSVDEITALFGELNFNIPPENIIKLIRNAFSLYFTFLPNNPDILRICFSVFYSNSDDIPLYLDKSMSKFLKTAPVKTKTRNYILGFTFPKTGDMYLKLEADYTGSLKLPGFMCME